MCLMQINAMSPPISVLSYKLIDRYALERRVLKYTLGWNDTRWGAT